jgi:plastocyanin
MKRIALIAALALAACEGEPPKTPVGHVVEPAPAVEAEPTADTPPAPAAGAACPCQCNCAGGGAVAAAAPTDGGVAATDAAAEPTTAAVATLGAVVGNITTTPKGQAGNAVVYLEDAPIEPTAKMSTTIDNHNMTFSPFVAVVPVGGKIVFHNSDPFPHNVFSPDNEKFDMGVIPLGQARGRSFKAAGHYALLCNLHPGMLGFVLVTPSSYVAKADGKGHFRMKDVPNGTYKITAWAPRQQPVTQSVTVKGGDVTLDFELHR